jgi:hypothetical protein
MLAPLFFLCPRTYHALKLAAAARHELCAPFLGTHRRDLLMRLIYPL